MTNLEASRAKSKVMAAMSGGVDSTTAAALLCKDRETMVLGVTLKLFEPQEMGFNLAQSQDLSDAKEAASAINIPHAVLDAREVFEEKVMEKFVAGYLDGETPNPCIFCNKQIKFGMLLSYAMGQGCQKLATGHYACVEHDTSTNRYLLKQPKDRHKDQTYMLCLLKQSQLSRATFPLSNLTKQEVRDLAREMGLKVFDKSESQDICFIKNGKYIDFIRQYSEQMGQPGPFVNSKGEIIGTHEGIANYTVGQRRGLCASFGKRVYVVAKNAKDNTVVLGEEKELFLKRLVAKNTNFIPFENLTGALKVRAKIRYAHPGADAVVSPLNKKEVLVEFAEPQKAVAPGQAVAFYDGEYVVGGGIIKQ